MSAAASNVILAEHQRAAAARTIGLLNRYRAAILADDVGLGKSFVAAEVARHFQSYGTTIDLVVPATLVRQWRETLARFGVTATLQTHTGIGSASFVADPGQERLVIVDEAHAFRNPATQRYDALARRSVGARVLLVTATPVCNRAGDLHALLALILADDALRHRGVASVDAAFERRDGDAIHSIVEEVMIRRGRDVLPASMQFGELARHFIRYSLFTAGGEVGRIVESLQFPLIGSAPLLRRFLWRRLESSEAALLESIRRQVRFYERATESLAGGRTLTKRDYRLAFGHEEDRAAFQQVLFWELWSPEPASDSLAASLDEEIERLTRLQQLVGSSPCEKRGLLAALCKPLQEPALIFTSSAATARDLWRELGATRRCGLVTSREKTDASTVFDSFRRGELDLVVSTDLAAEGLDLQRAGVVIHYDLPWNPVVLDQRNGRAYRIGQLRAHTEAIYFIPQSDPSSVVSTVAVKNRLRRRLLAPSKQRAIPAGLNIRPRVSETAAIVALERRLPALALPELAERRHKAGVERLIGEMSNEAVDAGRLDYLRAVLIVEAPI